MLSEEDLRVIEARARATSGERWIAGRDDTGAAVIHIERRDGSTSTMRLTRDNDPAAETDVDFVAHSRADVGRLVRAVRGQAVLSTQDVELIEARCQRASNGPWQAFLESDGGIGGSNVISIPGGEYEPDLYLWLDSQIAPEGDFDFVAHAREDIPRLLEEIRR